MIELKARRDKEEEERIKAMSQKEREDYRKKRDRPSGMLSAHVSFFGGADRGREEAVRDDEIFGNFRRGVVRGRGSGSRHVAVHSRRTRGRKAARRRGRREEAARAAQ